MLNPGRSRVSLVGELESAVHTLECYRRTEPMVGTTTCVALHVEGDADCDLLPPRLKSRRIEVVGDSISCGYGNEADDPELPFSADTENHYMSYGALVARELEAELRLVLPQAAGRLADDVARVRGFLRARGVQVIGPDGEIWIIECKSSRLDYVVDRKWTGYLPWCDRFFWAVDGDFPSEHLTCGYDCHLPGSFNLVPGALTLKLTLFSPSEQILTATERHIVVDHSTYSSIPIELVLQDNDIPVPAGVTVRGASWLYMWRSRHALPVDRQISMSKFLARGPQNILWK